MSGGKFSRILLTLIFISLLAVPLVLKRFRTRGETASS